MRVLLKYDCGFSVPSNGRSGGLAILWKEELNLSIISFSLGHIDAAVKNSENWWRFTRFYGNPMPHKRKESWEFLENLNSAPTLPWIIGGDFNEILISEEKLGGTERNQHHINAFRTTIDNCSVIDLGSPADLFTWSKRGRGRGIIKERLDRFSATNDMRAIFGTLKSAI